MASVRKFGRARLRFLKRQQALLPERVASNTGLIVTAAILTLIITSFQEFSTVIKIKDGVVGADIVAPRDFTVVDEEATEQVRAQAESHVAPVFEYDPKLRVQLVGYVGMELERMEKQFSQAVKERFGRTELSGAQLASPAYAVFLKQVTPTLRSNTLTKDEQMITLLATHSFNAALRQSLTEALSKAMDGYIYSTYEAETASSRRITLRNIETGEQSEVRSHEVISLPAAHKRLADEIRTIRTLSAEERERCIEMIKPLMVANLRFSESHTKAARAVARLQVPTVNISFRQNQIIARHGDPVTARVMAAAKYLKQPGGNRQRVAKVVGLLVIMIVILFALRRFSERTTLRQRLGAKRAFALICFTLVMQALLIQFGIEMSRQLARTFGTTGTAYEFLIPFAAAALIMAFLLDVVAAQVCALVVCLFAGFISRGDLGLMIYAVLSGTAATYGVERYRQRNSITRAGTIIGAINAVAVITVLLISNQTASLDVYFYNTLYGIAGGLLTAAVVSLLIPINESLFDILTDVKLLELSNMELPLLRELAMHAPGTQQHSMMVGSLAETAAESIDANALLVRVGCYYHDIGKLMAPEMFIENQQGRPNPHDTMEPKRSASVITGHVRKGMLMAQEAGLPQQIIDLIPQHHGTRRLHYFYNKALELVSKTGEPVNEDHYRYPGPRPQTREAAIVMLADCSEAAARTLDEPTPENIRNIIKRITDDVIADGQLEECELTMREFNAVRESLIQTLCNIYHHRIKYPGFNQPEDESEESMVPPAAADAAQSSEQQMAAAAGTGQRRDDDTRPRNSGNLPPKSS